MVATVLPVKEDRTRERSVQDYDIFVSYAHEDRERVQALVDSLAEEGWKVFWDRTIPPGETWHSFIGAPLAATPAVIVCWSNSAIKSTWVQEEADDAASRNALIPVKIDEVKPPMGLRHIQAADLVSWMASGGRKLPELLKHGILRKLEAAERRTAEGETARRVAEATARAGEERRKQAAEQEAAARRTAEDEAARRVAEASARAGEERRKEIERRPAEQVMVPGDAAGPATAAPEEKTTVGSSDSFVSNGGPAEASWSKRWKTGLPWGAAASAIVVAAYLALSSTPHVADAPPMVTAPAKPAAEASASPAILKAPPSQATDDAHAQAVEDVALNIAGVDRVAIQERLEALGAKFFFLEPDGSFGPESRKAIATWQITHGLHPTGFLDANQVSALLGKTPQEAPLNQSK